MLVGSLSMLLVVIILTLDVDIGNLDVYLNPVSYTHLTLPTSDLV